MGTASARVATREGRASAPDRDIAVESLLRRLIDRMALDATWRVWRSEPGGVEVLFELTFDGMCYQLARRPAPPAAPRELMAAPPRIALSPREKEIVRLVAKGLPSKAIAEVLDVSLWTVGTHLRRIFAKLGVSSRAEMVAHAMRDDLLGGAGAHSPG